MSRPGQRFSEVRLDGYRFIAALDQGQIRLLTRNGLDWTDRLPDLTASASPVAPAPKPRASGTRIVVARKPKPKP